MCIRDRPNANLKEEFARLLMPKGIRDRVGLSPQLLHNIEESQRQEKRSSLSQLQERQANWEKRRSRQRGEPED